MLHAATSITGADVRRIMARVIGRRGAPTRIRSDNGSEFICETLANWLPGVGAEPIPVAAGSPWENGYIESFHSRLRDEFLERVIFEDVADARAKASWYRREYNAVRPHSSLGYATPKEFSAACDRRRIHQRTKRTYDIRIRMFKAVSLMRWTKKRGAGQRVSRPRPSVALRSQETFLSALPDPDPVSPFALRRDLFVRRGSPDPAVPTTEGLCSARVSRPRRPHDRRSPAATGAARAARQSPSRREIPLDRRPLEMVASGVLERTSDRQERRLVVKPPCEDDRSGHIASVAVAESHREHHARMPRQVRDCQVLARADVEVHDGHPLFHRVHQLGSHPRGPEIFDRRNKFPLAKRVGPGIQALGYVLPRNLVKSGRRLRFPASV